MLVVFATSTLTAVSCIHLANTICIHPVAAHRVDCLIWPYASNLSNHLSYCCCFVSLFSSFFFAHDALSFGFSLLQLLDLRINSTFSCNPLIMYLLTVSDLSCTLCFLCSNGHVIPFVFFFVLMHFESEACGPPILSHVLYPATTVRLKCRTLLHQYIIPTALLWQLTPHPCLGATDHRCSIVHSLRVRIASPVTAGAT